MQDDWGVGESRDDVRVEVGVGGEELLDERLVPECASEDEQLEVGKGLGQVGVRRVHMRRIGRGGAGL